MRAPPLIAALMAVAAFGGCHKPGPGPSASAPIASLAAPPAPGLWAQRVADSHGVFETRYCLDQAAARRLGDLYRKIASHCPRRDMARAADGSWRFVTRCAAGAGGEAVTEGAVRGELSTRLVVEADQRRSGGGETRLTAEVGRLGPCPASMKPGEVILPGGRRTSLSALAASA